MNAQQIDAASLLKQLEALTKQVAKLVEQESASQSPQRRQVIARAKSEIESIEEYRRAGAYTPIEFHVNQRKGTVVALRKTIGGNVMRVGKAKVSPDDKFDAYIGKIIAMRRALGKSDLDVYTNAPQK